MVCSMDKLRVFSPDELRLHLCGEQSIYWTREEILAYTQPKNGYDKDSAVFQAFADVLVRLGAEERKQFLQFATGCSCLPPGGLKNLQPRLTIVRKEGDDESFPSVNTCAHYLKLPPYSSADVLQARLTAVAQVEIGFHLN